MMGGRVRERRILKMKCLHKHTIHHNAYSFHCPRLCYKCSIPMDVDPWVCFCIFYFDQIAFSRFIATSNRLEVMTRGHSYHLFDRRTMSSTRLQTDGFCKQKESLYIRIPKVRTVSHRLGLLQAMRFIGFVLKKIIKRVRD